MGEYAKRLSDNQEIKIGTCESMYYLRYEDQDKVNYNFRDYEFRFRVPFIDEDGIKPGDYNNYNRGISLYNINTEGMDKNTGLIQLTHKCGLLVNVECYHGLKLPEGSKDMRAFWNGKNTGFELVAIKKTKKGLFPIIGCKHCGSTWMSDNWKEIIDSITEPELKKRLIAYSNI